MSATENNEESSYKPKINEFAQNFLADLKKERSRLSEDFPLCALLIDDAFARVYSSGRIPGRELYADVLKQKPIKLTQKVFVPVKQYPKFNFTGKILGPKGNSLIRLQEETQCKILIKGRNSMRDRVKEEELRQLDDPRYSHLHKNLFLEISTVATPAECYARIAYALAEIRKYLIPDKNDEISHEQLREIMEIDPEMAKNHYVGNPDYYKSVLDKSETSKGPRKYLGLLKRTLYTELKEAEDENEYHFTYAHTRASATPPTERSSAYEYMKVPSVSKGYKRAAAAPAYAETKRIRGVSSSKPHAF